jgi:hypothetical protein
VWLFSSGTFVAYGVSLAVRAIKIQRSERILASELLSEVAFRILLSIGLLVVLLQSAHAVGIGLQQSVWWYLICVTWLLTSAGYSFFFVIRSWVRRA